MSRSKDTDLQSLMTRCGSTLYSKPVPENHVQNEAIEFPSTPKRQNSEKLCFSTNVNSPVEKYQYKLKQNERNQNKIADQELHYDQTSQTVLAESSLRLESKKTSFAASCDVGQYSTPRVNANRKQILSDWKKYSLSQNEHGDRVSNDELKTTKEERSAHPSKEKEAPKTMIQEEINFVGMYRRMHRSLCKSESTLKGILEVRDLPQQYISSFRSL